ncbi:MAG TPA: NusG domain II-containing protein [Clostridiales bacterium]|jgi:hypothetical protein|nr:NusG domain II-containing protein [Clostridiales bacterium]
MNEKKIRKIKSSRPFALWDIAVFAFLAVMVITFMAASLNIKEEGSIVRVYVDNKFFADYDINQDGQFDITNSDGEVLMALVIQDKEVWAQNSTCPDHICEMTKISYAPQQIICLPNNVYITILGSSDIDIIMG